MPAIAEKHAARGGRSCDVRLRSGCFVFLGGGTEWRSWIVRARPFEVCSTGTTLDFVDVTGALVESDGGHVGQVRAAAAGVGALAAGANLQIRVGGDHLGEDVENGLGDRLVVDADQVVGGRVDLEALVESKSGLDDVVGIGGQSLALGDLLQEVGLAALDILGEALLLSLDNGLGDSLTLADGLELGLLLLGAVLLALVAAEVTTEVGVGAALVVEVEEVG